MPADRTRLVLRRLDARLDRTDELVGIDGPHRDRHTEKHQQHDAAGDCEDREANAHRAILTPVPRGLRDRRSPPPLRQGGVECVERGASGDQLGVAECVERHGDGVLRFVQIGRIVVDEEEPVTTSPFARCASRYASAPTLSCGSYSAWSLRSRSRAAVMQHHALHGATGTSAVIGSRGGMKSRRLTDSLCART